MSNLLSHSKFRLKNTFIDNFIPAIAGRFALFSMYSPFSGRKNFPLSKGPLLAYNLNVCQTHGKFRHFPASTSLLYKAHPCSFFSIIANPLAFFFFAKYAFFIACILEMCGSLTAKHASKTMPNR